MLRATRIKCEVDALQCRRKSLPLLLRSTSEGKCATGALRFEAECTRFGISFRKGFHSAPGSGFLARAGCQCTRFGLSSRPHAMGAPGSDNLVCRRVPSHRRVRIPRADPKLQKGRYLSVPAPHNLAESWGFAAPPRGRGSWASGCALGPPHATGMWRPLGFESPGRTRNSKKAGTYPYLPLIIWRRAGDSNPR